MYRMRSIRVESLEGKSDGKERINKKDDEESLIRGVQH